MIMLEPIKVSMLQRESLQVYLRTEQMEEQRMLLDRRPIRQLDIIWIQFVIFLRRRLLPLISP